MSEDTQQANQTEGSSLELSQERTNLLLRGWDITCVENAGNAYVNFEDNRSALFIGIVNAIELGANPNSVFMPRGEDIVLPSDTSLFFDPESVAWVQKNGLTAVGLCVVFIRPKALQQLIDCGADVDVAYPLATTLELDGNGSFLMRAGYNRLVANQLLRKAPTWKLLQPSNVIYQGEIRAEVCHKTWVPNRRIAATQGNRDALIGKVTSINRVTNAALQPNVSPANATGKSGCLIIIAMGIGLLGSATAGIILLVAFQ
jgi:hypothetical protein